jgi:hypothetical protein
LSRSFAATAAAILGVVRNSMNENTKMAKDTDIDPMLTAAKDGVPKWATRPVLMAPMTGSSSMEARAGKARETISAS